MERRATLSDKKEGQVKAFESQRCILHGGPNYSHGMTLQMEIFCLFILVHTLVPISEVQQELQWTKSGENSKNAGVGCVTQYKSKQDAICEARFNSRKVHFAALMDVCHPKTRSIGRTLANTQKQCGAAWRQRLRRHRWLCRTEQEASASHMTAAQALDTISRLPCQVKRRCCLRLHSSQA